MLRELKKMWLDATSFQGRYVAKDLRSSVAFAAGIAQLLAAGIAGFFGKSVSIESGTFLLVYAAGEGGMKQFFAYKNNAVASDCPNATAPTGDSDEPRQEPG